MTYWKIRCAAQDIGRVTRILGEPEEIMEQIDAAGVVMVAFADVNIAADTFFKQCDEGTPFVLEEEEYADEYPGVYLHIRRLDGKVQSRMQDGDDHHFCRIDSTASNLGVVRIDQRDFAELTAFVSDEYLVRRQIMERGVAWVAEQQTKKAGGGEVIHPKPAHDLTLHAAIHELTNTLKGDILTDAPEYEGAVQRLYLVAERAKRLIDGVTVVGGYDSGDLYCETYLPGECGVTDADSAIGATGEHCTVTAVLQGCHGVIDELMGPTPGESTCLECGTGYHKSELTDGKCEFCAKEPTDGQ